MKYKNIGKKVIHLKINGEWKSVEPDEIIELNVRINEKSLVKVLEKEIEKVEEISTSDGKEKDEEEDEEKEEDKKSGKSELKDITLIKLKKMTIDEMNDLSAKYNLGVIKPGMKKKKIFEKIRGKLGL